MIVPTDPYVRTTLLIGVLLAISVAAGMVFVFSGIDRWGVDHVNTAPSSRSAAP